MSTTGEPNLTVVETGDKLEPRHSRLEDLGFDLGHLAGILEALQQQYGPHGINDPQTHAWLQIGFLARVLSERADAVQAIAEELEREE
jgi:hypothetical protein